MNGVPGTCSISNGLIYEALVHPVCRRDLTYEVQRIFCKRLNGDLKVKKSRYCSSIATESLLII
jgi:hypothetical protein